MTEIESLANRVRELSQSVDLWNATMLWGLFLAFVAAAIIGVATRMVVVRTGQQAEAQESLNSAKDRQLQGDLKDKDRQIAVAQKVAAKSQERAAELESNLLKLRKDAQPRRLTGAQKATLVRLLAGTHSAVAIVSRVMDTESADFADDLNAALHEGAGWKTVRIRNRISSKYGVSLGTVAGTAFSSEAHRLDAALADIGVMHDNPTFNLGDASTSPAFQAGVLYLVVEQHPPITNP